MARKRSDIRERLVEAAHAVFLERGVDAAPLRAIARRARTNLGMVYYYFPTKDDLFMAVVEERYAHLLAAIAAIIARPEPLRERVRALYRRIGAMTQDEAEVAALVAREALSSPERRARVFERFWRGHIPLLVATLEDGKRTGAVAAGVPTPLLLAVLAGVGIFPQFAARALALVAAPSGDALADRLAELLFDGIGPASAQAEAAG
jgi:AcrR family transcriptional regulator